VYTIQPPSPEVSRTKKTLFAEEMLKEFMMEQWLNEMLTGVMFVCRLQ